MIVIEELKKADPQALDELTALAHALHCDARTPEAADLQAMAHDTNTILMVVREDGRIIGMATLYIIQKLGRRTASMEDVIVEEGHRGQGLGTRLVSALIEEGKKRGIGSISLTSRAERVAARKLYESLGFAQRETGVFKLTIT
jgi:ribosomal protein S18 acetylase RimI-like enzyme